MSLLSFPRPAHRPTDRASSHSGWGCLPPAGEGQGARAGCPGQVAGPDSRSLGWNRNGAQLRPSRNPGRLRGVPLLSCPKPKRARPCRGPGRPHRHTAWLLLLSGTARIKDKGPLAEKLPRGSGRSQAGLPLRPGDRTVPARGKSFRRWGQRVESRNPANPNPHSCPSGPRPRVYT